MNDITTLSPAEVDAQIWDAVQRAWKADDRQASLTHSAHQVAGDRKVYGWGRGERNGKWQLTDREAWTKTRELAGGNDYTAEQAARLFVELRKTNAEHEAAIKDIDAGQNEYNRRGRWTRAYLVDNADGHVHKSENCSTWRYGTRYHWLTELSGQAESEIVELAGERACTVCYPSAPVDVLKRPSKLEGPAQQAAREAAEAKAAAKAAKDAEKIVVDIAELDHSPRSHTFKTVRGATNYIAGCLSDLCWYGETHPYARNWVANVERIRKALADRGVDYDYDKALAAARKKVIREGGGQAKY